MSDEVRAAKQDLSALKIHRDSDRPRGNRALVLSIAGVVLLGGGWIGWRQLGGGAKRARVETALVRRVGTSEGSAVLAASGYILPERKANVSSKAFGRIDWIGVDVNSRVKKDEVIARLASADLQARVDEAKTALEEAERELARWQKLFDDGAGERERVDRQKTAVDVAKARVKSAEAELAYMEIRAPFDGIVVRKNAEVGETVGPSGGSGAGSAGGSICTIVDPASLEMVADVNETNIAKIEVGQQAEVVTDAHPDRRYRALVRMIVPTADRQKGIVQVKVKLLEMDERLLPEMSARATFLRAGAAASTAKRVMAPKGAVRERGGRKVAFVVEGDRVRMVGLEVGVDGEDGTEIISGLSGGETVVTGGEAVDDGSAVDVQKK